MPHGRLVVGRGLVEVDEHLVQERGDLPVGEDQDYPQLAGGCRPNVRGPLRKVGEDPWQNQRQVQLEVGRRQGRGRAPRGERLRQEAADRGVVEVRRDLNIDPRPVRLLRLGGAGFLRAARAILGRLRLLAGLLARLLRLGPPLPDLVLQGGGLLEDAQGQGRHLLRVLVGRDPEQQEEQAVLELVEAGRPRVGVEGRDQWELEGQTLEQPLVQALGEALPHPGGPVAEHGVEVGQHVLHVLEHRRLQREQGPEAVQRGAPHLPLLVSQVGQQRLHQRPAGVADALRPEVQAHLLRDLAALLLRVRAGVRQRLGDGVDDVAGEGVEAVLAQVEEMAQQSQDLKAELLALFGEGDGPQAAEQRGEQQGQQVLKVRERDQISKLERHCY
mmetsp:Transcript_57801/g.163086  ORF Transcript_57801/g.163086 Transcript_57801/m.163086 type:complete len:387 (+) Transcript_57801:1572-2732(+)